MQINHILLDMDGVVADFVGGVLQIFGQTGLIHDWPAGKYDIISRLGVKEEEFWQTIDAATAAEGFWEGLSIYPWVFDLIKVCTDFAPVTFSTSPCLDPQCAAQKINWLRTMLCNPKFNRIVIGSQKYLMAKPGNVLIDDSDRIVDMFREEGGEAVVFPMPWNNYHGVRDRLAYVKTSLLNIQGASQ